MSKIYVNAVRPCGEGFDVYTSEGNINVSANIVRCALGRDLDYLLKCRINGSERAFVLSESDAADFAKYKAVRQ